MIEIKINTLRGIPPGIRAVKRRTMSNPSETKSWETKPKPRKPAIKTNILEKLLYEGKQHYVKIIEMLKIFPESVELLEKETDLKNVINQLKNQLQAREEKNKNKY